MRDIFRGKLGIFLRRCCCVSGPNNDIGRDSHLPKSGLVHAKPLNVSGSHRKSRFHPVVAHVNRGFSVKLHLLAQVGGHHLIVLPSALVRQKQIGINPGTTEPQCSKSPLRMPCHANLIWINVWSPSFVREQMSDVQTDIARALPEPVAHIQCARIKRIGSIMVEHGYQIAVRRQVLTEPSIARAVAAGPVRKHHEWMLQPVRHNWRVFV
jgi:hypothetical protein